MTYSIQVKQVSPLPIYRKNRAYIFLIYRNFSLIAGIPLLNTNDYFDVFSVYLKGFLMFFRRFFWFLFRFFNRNHYRQLFHILFFTEIISITLNLILLIIWRILWTLSSSQYHRYFGLQEPPSSALFNLIEVKAKTTKLPIGANPYIGDNLKS